MAEYVLEGPRRGTGAAGTSGLPATTRWRTTTAAAGTRAAITSAGFDIRAYEAHDGDVAAAEIDPMLHDLTNGAVEGRGSFGDGHFS